jgi:uncharacterized protein (TIGR01777 family)
MGSLIKKYLMSNMCYKEMLKRSKHMKKNFRILVTGATGFIGRGLSVDILRSGYQLVVLSRNIKEAQQTLGHLPARYFEWPDFRNRPPQEAFEGVDYVVHLAGAGVTDKRWTPQRKEEILQSRILGTKNLVDAILEMPSPPKAVIGASAIAFYGSRSDELLTESSNASTGYLSELCQSWEKAYAPLRRCGIRNVVLRIGIVLGSGGGPLSQMLPFYRLCLGGRIGSGRQWISWIHVSDMRQIIMQSLKNSTMEGVFNAVAPNPVQNIEFNRSLAACSQRPGIAHAPAFALKLVAGEMSHLVLDSQRVSSDKILSTGFKFAFDDLNSALQDLLQPLQDNFSYGLNGYQWVSAPLQKVFPFFSNPHNLEKITPPWLQFKVDKMSTPEIQSGMLIDYKLRVRALPLRWRTLIELWNPPKQFVDVQLKGPYNLWHHTHTFEEISGGVLLSDQVRYRLPLGLLGDLVHLIWVKNDVAKIFQFRQKTIAEMFQ